MKALTKGTHVIYGPKNTATKLEDKVKGVYKQHASGQNNCLQYQWFFFSRAVKSTLKSCTLNGVYIPEKFEFRVMEPSDDGDDVEYMVFQFEWESSDSNNLNHEDESNDSTLHR